MSALRHLRCLIVGSVVFASFGCGSSDGGSPGGGDGGPGGNSAPAAPDCPSFSAGFSPTAGNNCQFQVTSGGKMVSGGTCDRGGVVRDTGEVMGGTVQKMGGLLQLRGNRPGTTMDGFTFDIGFKVGSWDGMSGFQYALADGATKLTDLQLGITTTYSGDGISAGCFLTPTPGTAGELQGFMFKVDSTSEVCRLQTSATSKQRFFLVHGSVKCTTKGGDQFDITF